ncbi:FAD-dependent oxidoreductase [Streptomyces noboritoensis]|uniref:FAD-dependent oxidoreductase n=1 Tax=Streptomyces noboritoensis TaxID=67337 RepID=A0ABV6TAW6_9ACTN
MIRSSADGHAVVVGAGLAGLLSAQVLARRFARVTLVERDRLPQSGPAFRPGVPQSRHVHLLWSRGLDLIESQLPGITDDLLAGGARLLRAPTDLHWPSPVDWFGPMPGTTLLAGSRELIEWTVRQQVLREKRIEPRTGTEAIGLLAAPGDAGVRGIGVRPRGTPNDDRAEQLTADFVLDASGRTWRHYERLRRWPDGFVVLGDASCRFNPVYGHGMTVAALAAHSLAQETEGRDHHGIRRAARRIQRRTAASASTALGIALGGDLRSPDTEGPQPGRFATVLQRYMPHLLAGANKDPVLSHALFDVLSLNATPSTLFAPSTVIRVLGKWRLPTAPATEPYPPNGHSARAQP